MLRMAIRLNVLSVLLELISQSSLLTQLSYLSKYLEFGKRYQKGFTRLV